NDCNRWGSDRGLPRVAIEAFAANLGEMVERARAFGAQAVVLHTNHSTAKGEPYDTDSRAYNARIRDVAGARPNVVLVDVEAGVEAGSAHLLDDGIHLSVHGHDVYLH